MCFVWDLFLCGVEFDLNLHTTFEWNLPLMDISCVFCEARKLIIIIDTCIFPTRISC